MRTKMPHCASCLVVVAAACLALASILLSALDAQADSLVIPAWAFERGNARIEADPAGPADVGPVVVSGPRQPWGWSVEYEIDLPVSSDYLLRICYAADEARPVDVFFDSQNIGTCCLGVTSATDSPAQATEFSGKSSSARWEGVQNQWGRLIKLPAQEGSHTIKLARRGPLPHLVALRLDTPAEFPREWQPPRFDVRDMNSIPAQFRQALLPSEGFDLAALRWEIEDTIRSFGPRYPDGPQHLKELADLEEQLRAAAGDAAQRRQLEQALLTLRRKALALWSAEEPAPKAAGTLTIPAWTFDRGNVPIHAGPEQYADAGPIIGSGPDASEPEAVQYDIDFPASGEYTLQIRYASGEARPVEVFLDGRKLGTCCTGVAFGSAPFEHPVRFSWDRSGTRWETLEKWQAPLKVSISQGRHTLRLSRRGPLPHLVTLRLDTAAEFPKDWQPPERKVANLDAVPPRQRAAFLPPDAVNVAALRLAIEDTAARYGAQYAGAPQYVERLAELEEQQRAAANGPAEQREKIEAALKSLRREAMLAHPALRFGRLLFVRRTHHNAHIYESHCANEMGGSLCVLSPVAPDGKVTELVPELAGGRFGRFDLSFDATRVVFAYKRKDEPFRIYEIKLDPSTGLMVRGSLRQLSFGGQEESAAIERYGPKGRGIDRGFDDIDPCYLPDGRIVFASSRTMRNVFCFPATVTSLFVMDADGRNLRCISPGPLNEMNPCVLDDGSIAYTRWEYVDKGLGNGQSLWTIRPDGSGVGHLFKNTIVHPAGMLYPRSIPGSHWIVTIGAPHCGREGGPVILIDPRLSRRSPEAMTCITPEIGYPCMYQANWDMGFFHDPYPLSERFFLVSHSPGPRRKQGEGYGIYVLDTWGNRAELYRDPQLSCFQPIPLRPRVKPNAIPRLASAQKEVRARELETPSNQAAHGKRQATLFIQDIYQGLTGIERGRVKYVRVMGVLPWPWSEEGMFRIGLNVGVHRKRVYGVARVHEDGSARFVVPAEENVFFQVLDEDYMVLQHMPTFIYLMPGEQRSCVGCHEPDDTTPSLAAGRVMALDHPPEELTPQPGDTGPRTVDYAADVQPVLDKHCVGCHSGNRPAAQLDLVGVPTRDFNRAYENLIGRGLVSYRDCRYGRSGFRPLPPLSYGAHLSPLVARLRTEPCRAGISREEFIKIVTWIDANVPYYGTYRGKRNIQDKDAPDFRALPLAGK